MQLRAQAIVKSSGRGVQSLLNLSVNSLDRLRRDCARRPLSLISPGHREPTTPSSVLASALTPDDYLLKYESAQRDAENAIRREARNALATKGIIATETEIRRWRAERQAERDEAAAAAREARAAVDAIEAIESVEASTVARLAQARGFAPDVPERAAETVAEAAAVVARADAEPQPASQRPQGSS